MLSSPAPHWQQAVWGRRLLPPAAQPEHPAAARKATHRWLASAESQFNPIIRPAHSPVSLLGDLHTPGERPPLGTSQASTGTAWVLGADDGVPRVVHYQPEADETNPLGSRGAGACAMAAHAVSSGAPRTSAKCHCHCSSSLAPTGGTPSVPSRDGCARWGSFHFLPAHTLQSNKPVFVLKKKLSD